MKTLLIAASFLLAAPSPAPVQPVKPAPYYMPGPEHRGGGFVSVVYVPSEMIEPLCGKPPPGSGMTLACAGESLMVMPNPCEARFEGESFAAIQCHENAHQIHGWKHP